MLNDSYSDLVDIDVRAELVEHLDEDDTSGTSFEDEKDPLTPHARYLLLNLSIDITVRCTLLLPWFLRHVFKHLPYVEVWIQFINPVIQHVKDFLNASLLLRRIARD